jgi:hypothetical protein
MNRMAEREALVEPPWAADCCPWVGKLRTVLPITVGGGGLRMSWGVGRGREGDGGGRRLERRRLEMMQQAAWVATRKAGATVRVSRRSVGTERPPVSM